MVLGAVMGMSCSSEPPPPGSDGSSSSGGVADGDWSGPTDSTAASSGSTGSSAEEGSAEAGSSTGETFEECVPRAFDDWGAFQFFEPDVDTFVYSTTQAACTFVQQIEPPEWGTFELELACEPTDDSLPPQLVLRLWAELDALPFAPGDPLQLTITFEPVATSYGRLHMTMRDPEGELLVAGVQGQGFGPMDPEGAMFFAPFSFGFVDGLCPAPCEELGCLTRAALDVTLATQTTRILDGNAVTLGESPSYRVHVGAAMTGMEVPDDPGVHLDAVIVRQP